MNIIAAFFSILMPGVGQMFNGQIAKGVTFMVIEHFDNALGHINGAIHFDFNGFHEQALQTLVFNYAMFYPGFYVFTVWDAFYNSGQNVDKKSAISFVIAGFLGEFGTIFASHFSIPTLTIGLSMLIPMIVSIIIYR